MLRLLFLVATLATITFIPLKAETDKPLAAKGILDLRAWDFEEQGPVKLDGEWGFYWKTLLAPDEIAAPQAAPQFFYFPRLWNGNKAGGTPLTGKGYATYTLYILLPPDRPAMSFWVEDFYSSYQLFINGEVFSQNGKVGTSADEYEPDLYPKTKPLRTAADTLTLVLQIANFHHRKGGSSQSILLGDEMQLAQMKERELAYDWILAGAMLMGAVFFFGLYQFGRHDKPMLFFALFCLAYSYRNIGSDIYAVHAIWESIPYTLLVRLEHLSVFLGLYFFTKYLMSLYPEEVNKPVLSVFLWITLFLAALTSVSPIWLITLLLPYYLYLLLIIICYAVYIVVMAAIHRRPAAMYALVAKLTVFAIVSYNTLVYFGFTPRNIFFNFSAHIIFFLFQALILSFRFAFYLKEAKAQAEKASMAKMEFLSTMSHEMRTPLNAVMGMTNFLIQDKPRENQKENLTTLKSSAERLTNLINDVLDFSKIDSGKIEFAFEKTSFREVLQSVHQIYEKIAHDKGLEFQLKIAEDAPEQIMCDKNRLGQVLANLTDNAIKFTPNGFVHLLVSVEEKDTDSVKLLFEVIDSGIGIEAAQKERIFESFSQVNTSTTREYGGTGLGLSIIRRLLQLQGSDIQLVSTPGEGSRFYFSQWFGLVKVSETAPAAPALQPAPATVRKDAVEGKKILVVEDNKVNVLVIKKFLKKWGAEIDIADNGKLAVDKYLSTPYDLILMDLQMPVMDGYQCTSIIREKDKSIPIIALTAAVPSEIREKILDAGMNDYVSKPFVPEDLHEKLIKYLSVTV